MPLSDRLSIDCYGRIESPARRVEVCRLIENADRFRHTLDHQFVLGNQDLVIQSRSLTGISNFHKLLPGLMEFWQDIGMSIQGLKIRFMI